LALHSFVESHACAEHPPLGNFDKFPEMLWAFGDVLKARGVPVERLAALTRISKEHFLTNKVRHAFVRLDAEEVLAATHNFLAFCGLCGIASPSLERLRAGLQAWDDKHSPLERSAELRRMRDELTAARQDNRRLLERLGAYERDAARAAELGRKVEVLAAELTREKARADAKAERVDELRRALNDATLERTRLAKELEGYRDLERYLEHLARFTLYTRTRRDYERSLMRLTPEQREALEEIRPGHDFLIRGGAGTGKTIVLLHAFDQARRERDAELGFGRPARMALLTYTNTLVKYDRYLAAVLHATGVDDLISTADAFFLARLRRIDARARVDYGVVARLAASLNGTEFLTNVELAAELEDFLFANAVTREEYIDNVVLRRGMRQPLSAQQRALVWGVRARVIDEMERAGILSKNWSRMRLIDHLEKTPGDPALCDVDLAYVDESQDLTAVDLKALKLMTRRGLVLAGDAGQTIYGVGSPYRRAGIDISGRTRVLRTSFRTTCAIQEAADRYRALTRREEEEPNPQAFREGPVPELYAAATRDEMDRLLLARVALFIDTLGYDAENVTVLAPSRGDVARLGQLLARAGRPSADIREEAFAFSQSGAVRLSTLHSSKGLDFPVVLLYLPGLPAQGDWDEAAGDTLARNLIYVAMTRAMDSLSVFTLAAPPEKPLADLVAVFAQPAPA
ncbi:MAG: AAA family ATPase, partial [Spirochaetes bacterium]|nr:AAA family ATPase [Spirochaetota bacterium]